MVLNLLEETEKPKEIRKVKKSYKRRIISPLRRNAIREVFYE